MLIISVFSESVGFSGRTKPVSFGSSLEEVLLSRDECCSENKPRSVAFSSQSARERLELVKKLQEEVKKLRTWFCVSRAERLSSSFEVTFWISY